MSKYTRLAGFLQLIPLLTFVACGGSGSGGPPTPDGPAPIRTLAYVATDCREDARSSSTSQRLEILHGDQPAVRVMDLQSGRWPPLGLCADLGAFGGSSSIFAAFFQRLGVSPDGSGVVFEVTFDFSLLKRVGVRDPLLPEQEGIFFVRADGSGLRRLGPASREPAQRLTGLISTSGNNGSVYSFPFFSFSPDGRAITFTDRGPGPAGEEAPQVVTVDIASGTRFQVTHLPDAPPDPSLPAVPATVLPAFSDDNTIQFFSRANPNGLNAEGAPRVFTVKTDGTGLTVLPAPRLLAGSQIVPSFFITSSVTDVEVSAAFLPGMAVNPNPYFPPNSFYNSIVEVVVLTPDHTLQLTNFRRIDTGGYNPGGFLTSLSTDGEHVFFSASADPFGTNPSENCQLFSIDTLGADLRQLTQFRAADHSTIGCLPIPEQPGCIISGGPILDSEMRTLVINTNCDPLGTNANGGQYFAMRADGTGLRQLTATHGVVTAADGSVDVELPGPGVYSTLGFGGLY